MGFDEIVTLFQNKAGQTEGFGGKIRLDVKDQGGILFDGSGEAISVRPSSEEADTTVTLSLETLQKLLNNDLNPAMAFMSGKLSVSGNMALTMKLQNMIGGD